MKMGKYTPSVAMGMIVLPLVIGDEAHLFMKPYKGLLDAHKERFNCFISSCHMIGMTSTP